MEIPRNVAENSQAGTPDVLRGQSISVSSWPIMIDLEDGWDKTNRVAILLTTMHGRCTTSSSYLRIILRMQPQFRALVLTRDDWIYAATEQDSVSSERIQKPASFNSDAEQVEGQQSNNGF